MKHIWTACVLWILFSGVLASPASAQRLERPVTIESSPISGDVHMLQGRGGNIGLLVADEGAILIDDQFATHTKAISEAVKKLTDKPVRFLINTHWHGDHTGGNENFDALGVVVVAHDNVRKRMSAEQFNELFQRKTPASPEAALPTVTFTDTMTFHWGKEEVRVVHMANAHTDGDSFVHFVKANTLHMGDVFFNGMYPFIDTSTGGSLDGVIAAVDRALAMTTDETKIIPGHGPLASRGNLSDYRRMLVDVRETIRALIAGGQTLDQLLAAKPLARYDDKWGRGFMDPEKFLRCVHASLTKERG